MHFLVTFGHFSVLSWYFLWKVAKGTLEYLKLYWFYKHLECGGTGKGSWIEWWFGVYHALHAIVGQEVAKRYKEFKEIIETLVKGYQKQRTIEELVAKFLLQKQINLIAEINSQRITALREQVFDKVREFQSIKKNLEEQETRRIAEMRNRVQSAGIKKMPDFMAESPQLISDEYTDLDDFLDNAMFEETLNPGL